MIKPMLAYKVDKKPVDWSEKYSYNLSLTVFVVYSLKTVHTLVQVKNLKT